MADNPDERDNPYEPVEPDPTADADTQAPPDHAASAVRPDEAQTQPVPAPEPIQRLDSAGGERRDEPETAGAPESALRDDAAAAQSPEEPATTRVSTAGDPDGAVTSTFDVREAERTRPSGSHQAERPVPRSGLTEHRSAAHLTGDQLPLEQDDDLGREADDPAPTSEREPAAARLAGGTAAGQGATADADLAELERDRSERDVVLDGTTAHTRPPSRAGAHVWAAVLTLLLIPVAWYLLADGGARLTLPVGNPWETGSLNVAALLELGGGLLVLAVVLLAARWSSLGAIITGALVLLVGLPFVAVPAWTQQILEPVVDWLHGLGDFGGNVAHHLGASGSTGRLVVYGLALILLGVVSHGARRQGRREVRPAVGA